MTLSRNALTNRNAYSVRKIPFKYSYIWKALETPLLTSRDIPNNVRLTLNQNVMLFERL